MCTIAMKGRPDGFGFVRTCCPKKSTQSTTCVLARLQPCETTSHPHSAQQLLDELPLGGSEKLVDLQEKRSTVLQLPLGL